MRLKRTISKEAAQVGSGLGVFLSFFNPVIQSRIMLFIDKLRKPQSLNTIWVSDRVRANATNSACSRDLGACRRSSGRDWIEKPLYRSLFLNMLFCFPTLQVLSDLKKINFFLIKCRE